MSKISYIVMKGIKSIYTNLKWVFQKLIMLWQGCTQKMLGLIERPDLPKYLSGCFIKPQIKKWKNNIQQF